MQINLAITNCYSKMGEKSNGEKETTASAR